MLERLPVLTRVTTLALLGSALAFASEMITLGLDLSVSVVTACVLAATALTATGWRWTPLLGGDDRGHHGEQPVPGRQPPARQRPRAVRLDRGERRVRGGRGNGGRGRNRGELPAGCRAGSRRRRN
jgi:hypothetical protein